MLSNPKWTSEVEVTSSLTVDTRTPLRTYRLPAHRHKETESIEYDSRFLRLEWEAGMRFIATLGPVETRTSASEFEKSTYEHVETTHVLSEIEVNDGFFEAVRPQICTH